MAAELLDLEYRSEQALTIALMGLMAEESLIAQRLGKLGRKTTGGKTGNGSFLSATRYLVLRVSGARNTPLARRSCSAPLTTAAPK